MSTAPREGRFICNSSTQLTMKFSTLAICGVACVLASSAVLVSMRETPPPLPRSAPDEPLKAVVTAQGETMYTRTVGGWRYQSHHAADLSDSALKGAASAGGVPVVDAAALADSDRGAQRGAVRP